MAGTSVTDGEGVAAGGTVTLDVVAGAIVGLGDGDGLAAT